jgi:hypothetical protein
MGGTSNRPLELLNLTPASGQPACRRSLPRCDHLLVDQLAENVVEQLEVNRYLMGEVADFTSSSADLHPIGAGTPKEGEHHGREPVGCACARDS